MFDAKRALKASSGTEHECLGSRYSSPFFCQANKDAVIQGPIGKYDPITAHEYLQQRIAANKL